MSTSTHYTTLELVSTAPPEVIRASYKALALIYHPDKTLGLPASERASHAAVFSQVQAAYDVLGNPALKAAYDAELAHHNDKVDRRLSTFHHWSTRTAAKASSTPQRKPSVKLTTPEEKAASRAKARQSIECLREKRAQRDAEDMRMEVAGLKDMVEIWQDLAEENKADPVMHAHCAIRIHEYEVKIADREQQHRHWLEKMSTAKQSPSTPDTKRRATTPIAPKKPAASPSPVSAQSSNTSRLQTTRPSSSSISPTPASRDTTRAEERKRAEAERTAAAAARAHARSLEKAQREAAKQAHMDRKAAAVRAEQDKQKARMELQAQQEAERIAKARAKAGAAPLGTVGASSGPILSRAVRQSHHGEVQAGTSAVNASPSDGVDGVRSSGKKVCSKCGVEHASIREWRKCSMQATSADEHDEESFLPTV